MARTVIEGIGGTVFLGKNGEFKDVTNFWGVWDWAGTHDVALANVRRVFKTEKAAYRFASEIGGISKECVRANR